MEGESLQVEAARYFDNLCKILYETLPLPGVNKYSKGNTRKGTMRYILPNGDMVIEIADGIDYGSFELGFGNAGKRLNPRGPNEAKNFKIVDYAINRASELTSGKGVEKQ